MAIQTKLAEGIKCRLCGRAIEGEIPVEPLSILESGKLLAAALADKCQHCEIFLCKECRTNEQSKLSRLRRLRGFDCPGCGSKFSGSRLSVYPADLNLNAVVAVPSTHQRPMGPIQTETAEAITCKHCGQPIEGKILVSPLPSPDARRTFPFAVGYRCQFCNTFLCQSCYRKAQEQLSGPKKLMGVACPHCRLQFYSPYGSNLGVYPAEVNLDSIVSPSSPEVSDEYRAFNKLLDDFHPVSLIPDYYREDYLENMLVRIRRHETLLLNHISRRIQYGDENIGVFGQSSKSLVDELVIIGRAGASWLLQREYLPDSYVDQIVAITQGRKPPLIISNRWYATLALIEIEIARKDGQLVPAIVQSYQSHAGITHTDSSMGERISVTIQLGRIRWDERVVDCLVETLDEEFRIPDPEFAASSLGDLFLDKHVAGPAQRAAESLVAIGDARGIAAIVPHLFRNYWYRHYEETAMDWCVSHGSLLTEHLVQGLDHEDSRVRLFVMKTLAKIGDPSVIGALSALENDPDRKVCDEARQAVKTLRE